MDKELFLFSIKQEGGTQMLEIAETSVHCSHCKGLSQNLERFGGMK